MTVSETLSIALVLIVVLLFVWEVYRYKKYDSQLTDAFVHINILSYPDLEKIKFDKEQLKQEIIDELKNSKSCGSCGCNGHENSNADKT